MSYEAAIKGLNLEVIAETYLGSYQGDWVAVLKDYEYYMAGEKAYGFLVYGYGSCSGCDSWQASRNAVERLEELSNMVDNIQWFSSLQSLKEYVALRDNANSWYCNEGDEYEKFRKAVAELEE